MKTCSRCKESKSLLEFGRNKSTKSGYTFDCKTCRRQKWDEWHSLNVDENRARVRKYRLNNLEAVKLRSKQWNRLNLERTRVYKHERRARVKQNGVYIVTKRDVSRLLTRPCLYCGKRAEEIDHVIPIHRGGTHGIGNLAPACVSCNRSKNKRFVTEWRRDQSWRHA